LSPRKRGAEIQQFPGQAALVSSRYNPCGKHLYRANKTYQHLATTASPTKTYEEKIYSIFQLGDKEMALKQCKECGNMVSDQAEKCPYCGAPNKGLEKCREIYQKVRQSNRNNQSPEEAKKDFEKFIKDTSKD